MARLLRRGPDASSHAAIGPEGGTVDAGAEAALRGARSGGSPIAEAPRQRLEQAFGGVDFGDVRLHDGPVATELNERFGARAFTVGSDIFFRDAAPTLGSPDGTELLAHELAHTVQQNPARAHRQVIRREYVASWDLTYAKLTVQAKQGYDQFLALNGASATDRVKEGAVEKKGDHTGEYNTERAESVWSKKFMEPEAFAIAMAKKQKLESDDVKATLKTMNHLCNETDGTHRPGSEGDGTSEWALKWEAEHGEPFRSPAGHAYKLRDYCKVLSEGLASLAAKKGSVAATEKMPWIEKDKAAEVEVVVLTQLALVVARATDRLSKMRSGVQIWNGRIAHLPGQVERRRHLEGGAARGRATGQQQARRRVAEGQGGGGVLMDSFQPPPPASPEAA